MNQKFGLISISVVAAFLMIVGASIDAEGAAYLKIGDISGESQDKDHKGWSDLVSFEHTISAGDSSAGRSSNVIFGDVVCVKEIDKSTPKLAEGLIMGKVFPSVEVHFTADAADSRITYLTYQLKNVQVTSYQFSGSGQSDEAPMEQISLNYEEIKVTYTEVDATGKVKGKVEASWKVEEGTT